MVTSCEISRLLRPCGRKGIAICQYCGRSFCAEHGDRLEDGQEICRRRVCMRKREDLTRHLAYSDEVSERNESERCGAGECGARPQGQCTKCRGLFCFTHVSQRKVEVRDGSVAQGSVCQHCHKRRKLWSRR